MMDTFLTYFWGSLIIIGGFIIPVAGSAWPDASAKKHPVKSVKNWLFAIGAFSWFILFLSILASPIYMVGGTILLIAMPALTMLASILMLSNVKEKISALILIIYGLVLMILTVHIVGFTYAWQSIKVDSIILLVSIQLSLLAMSLGFIFRPGTKRRSIALFSGAVILIIWGYLFKLYIVFWPALFFGLCSLFWLTVRLIHPKKA